MPMLRKSAVTFAAAGAVVASASSMAVFATSPEVDLMAVRRAIAEVMDNIEYEDGSLGPIFVRLAWHCSGTYDKESKTGGSNGANMRFKPESAHGANAGLHIARAALEPIKAKFPGLSYADLYTLAGVVAIEESGGPTIPWRAGRVDSVDGSKCTPDGRLPDATQGAEHLRAVFGRMGFNDREIVALSGAHTLGRCHPDRSGFNGPWTRAPTTFSNLYFVELFENKWTPSKGPGPKQFWDRSGELMMLPTDMVLTTDPAFKATAQLYAKNKDVFYHDFANAFSKLLALGVPFEENAKAAAAAQSSNSGAYKLFVFSAVLAYLHGQ